MDEDLIWRRCSHLVSSKMKTIYIIAAVIGSLVNLATDSETALFMAVLAGLALVQMALTGQ